MYTNTFIERDVFAFDFFKDQSGVGARATVCLSELTVLVHMRKGLYSLTIR